MLKRQLQGELDGARMISRPGTEPPGRTVKSDTRIAEARITPIALADPPPLNNATCHQPNALRAIIEIETEGGIIGLGESFGTKTVLDGCGRPCRVAGRTSSSREPGADGRPSIISERSLCLRIDPGRLRSMGRVLPLGPVQCRRFRLNHRKRAPPQSSGSLRTSPRSATKTLRCTRQLPS